MAEINLIDPENRQQVGDAIAKNPRLQAFLREIEQDVIRTVQLTVEHHGPTRMAVLSCYWNAMRQVQKMAEQAAQNPQIACGAGCWWCCSKPVQLTAPEIILIADHIFETWQKEDIDALIVRNQAYMAKVRSKPQSKWVYQRALCPLLDESGRCSAYQVRPLICRGWNSTNAETCEKGYNARWATGLYTMVFEYMTVVQMVGEYLRLHIEPQFGDMGQYVLGPALLIALTTPDARNRWVFGEDLFESARWRA